MFSIVNAENADHLEGPRLSAKILHRGAELYSLELRHPTQGTMGLLLNDGEEKPDHPWWNSHAPFLFPIVGGLVGGISQCLDGKKVVMEGHGFARKTVFTVRDSGADSTHSWIEYAIDDSMISGATYPWRFSFTIRYELSAASLRVSMMVVNEDRETMWYQIGWHPGFKTPFVYGKGSKSDVRLLLPEGMYTMYECDRGSFLTGKSERKLLGGAFPFTEEGLDYTYVFDMKEIPDRWAALYDPQSNIRVSLAFSDFPHLGVWSNSGAPFICLEPWQGCDDFAAKTPFENKLGIVTLDPGQTDSRRVLLSVDA